MDISPLLGQKNPTKLEHNALGYSTVDWSDTCHKSHKYTSSEATKLVYLSPKISWTHFQMVQQFYSQNSDVSSLIISLFL